MARHRIRRGLDVPMHGGPAQTVTPGPTRPGGGARRAALVAAALIALLGTFNVRLSRRGPADGVHQILGPTMGTSYDVKVDADLSPAERDAIRAVVATLLDRLEGLMSTYDSTSEVTRFNRHTGSGAFPASDELIEVLTIARDVSARSGGAFDVTVAPLVDAWGFGPAGTPTHALDTARLRALASRVDYRSLVVDRASRALRKMKPETSVDLSAIGHGYAAEAVAEALRALGHPRFLVEVGGELRAGQAKRDGSAWRVGVERPEIGARSLYATLDLIDQAIATSGDYRNYLDLDGVRYAHIVDPRSGWPLRYMGTSVTVVHADGAAADAWATALTVLGPEEGYDVAAGQGIAALWLVSGGSTPRAVATPAFVERFGIPAEGRAR